MLNTKLIRTMVVLLCAALLSGCNTQAPDVGYNAIMHEHIGESTLNGKLKKEEVYNNYNAMKGTKLVTYLAEEDLFTQEYVPEKYQTSDPEEVKCIMIIEDSFRASKYGIQDYVNPEDSYVAFTRDYQTLKVKIVERTNGVVLARNEFTAESPDSAANSGTDYVDPKIVSQWAEAFLDEYIPGFYEVIEYNNAVVNAPQDAYGGKLICMFTNWGLAIPKYVPLSLMVQDPSEFNGFVYVTESFDEDNKLPVHHLSVSLSIYEPAKNGARAWHFAQEDFYSEPGEKVEEVVVENWIDQKWDEYNSLFE